MESTLMTVNGIITAKIPNGIIVTYENGFIDRCTDDPEEEPLFIDFEVGDEVEWALVLDENGSVFPPVTFDHNLETLRLIIEASFHIGRLTITGQSAMCDFPAYLGAIEKVSVAVGFEVKDTDYIFDIARRITSNAAA